MKRLLLILILLLPQLLAAQSADRSAAQTADRIPVSYTHLTLPTN